LALVIGVCRAESTPAELGAFVPSPYYLLRTDLFAATPLTSRDIVFLGDSITEGAEWNELFPALPVRDRGIGGDTTAGILARLADVTAARPVAIFLLVGTNDLASEPRSDASLARYREIVARIRRETPATRLFVQSLLPRSAVFRARIEAYNRELAGYCREPGCTFVDLYPAFLAADGSLRGELTVDGLHLNGAGFLLWKSLLAPYVERLPVPDAGCTGAAGITQQSAPADGAAAARP
jgi:lysophospholipase L1-like esterase